MSYMALNFLVVDDATIVREVIAKALRLAKVPVNALHEASNGREALAVLAQHAVDLVFTDIHMPVMGGVELIDRMASNGLLQRVPVVVVSIDGSLTRIEQLKTKGIRAYIRKPFSPETIRSVIQQVTGERDGR